MLTKICTACKSEKDLEDFYDQEGGKYGKTSICKPCKRLKNNSEDGRKKRRDHYRKNKKKINKEKRERYKNDEAYRIKLLTLQKAKYLEKRDEKLEYQKEYQKRPKNRKRRNKKTKERRKKDIQFKLTVYIRNRIGSFFRNRMELKPNSSIEALECTLEELIVYIEYKFKSGMSWSNYGGGQGKWELDHIVPLCSFDLVDPKQYAAACHYTNLQPMWHEEHVNKTTIDFTKSLNKVKKK